MGLRAAILIDGGALTQQQDAIEEGLALFRELNSIFPIANVAYNLANELAAATGFPPRNANWLNHQELTSRLLKKYFASRKITKNSTKTANIA